VYVPAIQQYVNNPIHSAFYEYVVAREYRIPNDMLEWFNVLGLHSISDQAHIYKLHSHAITVRLHTGHEQSEYHNGITLNGLSRYNVLDWIEFIFDDMEHAYDFAVYYVNCNPESEYFGNIMHEHNGIHTVVGSIQVFLNHISNWIKYTSETPKIQIQYTLNDENVMPYLIRKLSKAGFNYIRPTNAMLLRHAHEPRGEHVELFNLDTSCRQRSNYILYQGRSVQIDGISDEKIMEQIKNIQTESASEPIFNSDDAGYIIADMYAKCVYADRKAAIFSEWLQEQIVKN
jgi:hypothetical protein